MSNGPDGKDESWQARTHVIRTHQLVRPKTDGGDCLVIIYARNTAHLGRRFVLDHVPGGCWVGRGSENAIMLESDTCSRRHARFEARADGWWVVDNQSTNGTYVNDEPVVDAQLRRGDHVKIGDTIFKYLAGTDVEAEFIQTIGAIMVTDGLTQAHNRRYLTEQLEKELPRARRHRRPLVLIMFDLDHFKLVNDTYGHLAGDYVLREVASVVRSHMQGDGVFARYGGEEFALLMPETELRTGQAFAEELRDAVASHPFVFDGARINVTMSLGVAVAHEAMHSADDLIRATDSRLYAAKGAGRNRVMG